MPISRALISVSDKSGLVPFCKELQDLGVDILSTGGTANALRKAGRSPMFLNSPVPRSCSTDG